jgi:hypothetical protein
MTRSQALLAAGVITAAAVAFVVGAGARSGAFGFGGDGAPPDLPAATVTDAAAAPFQPDAIATTTVGTRREGGRRLPFERRGERRERQENDDDD